MDFGSNFVLDLERVVFGLKCVLHRVRVLECRPSRAIQNLDKQPPNTPHPTGFPSDSKFLHTQNILLIFIYYCHDHIHFSTKQFLLQSYKLVIKKKSFL